MKKTIQCILILSIPVLLSTCSRVGGDSIRVSFNIQKARARGILANAADYPCFGLVVTGEGVPSLESGTGNRLPADRCPYAGASSNFVPLVTAAGGASAQVEAMVPAGKNRLIQVVALEYSSASSCPSGTVAQFIRASNQGTAPAGYGGLYEVGYVIKDLLSDTEITVPKIYDVATAQNLRGCASVSSALALSPAGTNLQIRSGSTISFAASGGVAPYSFSKTGTGTVDALGNYVASASGGQTGSITVTDSVGSTATTSLTTFSRSAPVAWYAAETFGNTTGAAVSSWTSLGNSGSLSLSGTATLIPSVINGFPAVRVDSGSYYSVSPANAVVGVVHGVVVARVAITLGGLFCIAPTGICSGSYLKLYGTGSPTGLYGAASNGSDNTFTSSVDAGTGFFVAELYADLNTTEGVQLTTSTGVLDGSDPASPFPLSLTGGQTILVGAAVSGTIDLAEVVIDYSASSITSPAATVAYLKAKYQL